MQTANPLAQRAVSRALRRFAPDVVHVEMFLTQLSPLILSTLRAVPTLYSATWYRATCPTGKRLRPDGAVCTSKPGAVCRESGCLLRREAPFHAVQRALLRRGAAAIDRTLASSEAVAESLARDGWDGVQVLPLGVPVRPPRPALHGPPLAAYAGRFAPEKGIDVLVRAFARVATALPDARLLLSGDGEQERELRRLIADLALDQRVSVRSGHLEPTALEELLWPAWVQVVPGRWVEPFGLSAAEALMRGTAVLASSTGGPAQLVRASGGGSLVAPGDEDALAAGLGELLGDRKRCESLGAAGRAWALAHLDLERHVDRLVATYEELVAA